MLSWPPIQPETPNPKSTVEVASAVVVAIAAVFSVVAQSKDNPRLAVGLVLLAALIGALAFFRPAITLLQEARSRVRRNRTARAHYPEFLQFTKRFWKFVNPENFMNLRNIVFIFSGNDEEKLAKICPPAYLKDIYPIFTSRIESTRPKTEAEFCAFVREFCCFVASYNTHYVLEPFRRMQARTWPEFDSAAKARAEVGQRAAPIFLEPWLKSLSEQTRLEAERQIDAFREAWVNYLSDLIPFLEKLSDSLCDRSLPTYFEKPQRL